MRDALQSPYRLDIPTNTLQQTRDTFVLRQETTHRTSLLISSCPLPLDSR